MRGMEGRAAAESLASAVLVFLPSYAVERITEYYFLTHSALFGLWSGLRMELFVGLVLAASVTSGYAVKRFGRAAVGAVIGVFSLLVAFYLVCDPRVCYSTGIDGLEPLRLGAELASVAVASTYLGTQLRPRFRLTRWENATVLFASFVAIGYYPVIFTFAGTRLLVPFDPWAALLLLSVLSLAVTVTSAERLGLWPGLVVPLIAAAVVLFLSGTIALAYFSLVAWSAVTMAGAIAIGVALGALLVEKRRGRAAGRPFPSGRLFALVTLFLLAMTVVVIPDAVVGLVPAPGASNTAPLVMGVPVYAGAYMDAGLGSTEGVSVTLSFAGTNVSAIQEGNFLAGGLGAHSPGYFVDGIDYGYRLDVYLFHGGNETIAASAWEVCDHNAACGGHSWKVLMFEHQLPFRASNVSEPIHLAMEWRNRTLYWSYSLGDAPLQNLSWFSPPAGEKPYFNTGVLPGDVLSRTQSGSYFFQVGIFSSYPLGGGGWSATFACPATLQGSAWVCIAHAKTLQGGQSFWKALWRWGEDYPNIVASSPFEQPATVTFSYSAQTTMDNFVALW